MKRGIKIFSIFGIILLSTLIFVSATQVSDRGFTSGGNVTAAYFIGDGSQLTNIGVGACYVTANSESDLRNKILTCSNNLIYVPKGTYVLTQPINLSNDDVIIGQEGNNVNIDCSAVSGSCIKTSGGRIYRVKLSGLNIYGATGADSKGLDTTYISSSEFDSLVIHGFDYGIYGAGLNYYNDFYSLQIYGNNNNFYFTNASNEFHFFGGYSTNVNSGGNMVYIDNLTDSVKFSDFSFEGGNFNFQIQGNENILSGSRFECSPPNTCYINISGNRNQMFGGSLIDTVLTDTGKGNIILSPDTAYVLNKVYYSNQDTLKINDSTTTTAGNNPFLINLQKSGSLTGGTQNGIKINLGNPNGGNFLDFYNAGSKKFYLASDGGLYGTSTTPVCLGVCSASSHSLTNGDTHISGKSEFEDTAFFDSEGRFYSGADIATNQKIQFGTNSESGLGYFSSYFTQNPALMFFMPSSSKVLEFVDYNSKYVNLTHTDQTNPTIYLHSATSTTNQFIGFTHNQTNALIYSGTGDLFFTDDNSAKINIQAKGMFASANISVTQGNMVCLDYPTCAHGIYYNGTATIIQ